MDEKKINDNDYSDGLTEHSNNLLKKALEIIVCRKLYREGYYFVKDIINDIKIEDVNATLKLNEDELEGIDLTNEKKIQEKNTEINLNKILYILNNKISDINEKEAISIIALFLKQKINTKSSDYKYIKDKYVDVIFYKLEELQLIENYTIKDKFIVKNGIELESIGSLHDFVKKVSGIKEESNEKKLFFRGHSNVNYISEPSVFRNQFYKEEYNMYKELMVNCSDYFINCPTHFSIIKLMQHYQLPTRLLDITINPLVALYFACESKKDYGEVIIYNIEKEKIKYESSDLVTMLSCLPMFKYKDQQKICNLVNKVNKFQLKEKNQYIKESKESEIWKSYIYEINSEKPAFIDRITMEDLSKPIIVIPNRDNKRIINQKGAFILYGLTSKLMLDETSSNKHSNLELCEKEINEYRVKTIYYMKGNKKEEILKQLEDFGIDGAFLYPEIDKVAENIKAKFFK